MSLHKYATAMPDVGTTRLTSFRYGIPGSTSEVFPGVYRGLSLQQGANGPWLNTGVVPLASSLSSEPEHCVCRPQCSHCQESMC